MWRRARAATVGLLLFACACVGRPPADATGEQVYEQVCARCHAADLSGGVGPGIGAGSNAAEQNDEFLRLTITDGRGRMPSFRHTLSEEEINRVIEFMREEQDE